MTTQTKAVAIPERDLYLPTALFFMKATQKGKKEKLPKKKWLQSKLIIPSTWSEFMMLIISIHS